jgi:phosphohistidine phosphatase
VDLYLVRHAIAEPRDPGRLADAERTLTTAGAERFRLVARGLDRIGIEIGAVLSSTYARCWQTAELLRDEAEWPSPEPCEELEPPRPASACLAVIQLRTEPSLALVGHEPQLSELASLLLSGDEHAVRLELKKGGVICLRFDGRAEAGGGLLRWSVSPGVLRRVARR